MKIQVTNGAGERHDFTTPEENLWLEIVDENGRLHFIGSLYVTRDVFGAVSVELGTPENDGQVWEPTNPVRVFNESLHHQYQTPDRGSRA